ncbi:hypothetical protein NKR23_g5001 [Pleurostoma richardsiae]|uniref:DUF300-domain-containing protein n=1 Tax=Pleurostoma richardsiae TaxID=41990 RepID=A0AA38VK18_9PEZI|nr:hypothetical protein NKR23_g5001 [Pleurostoma richardsiae]
MGIFKSSSSSANHTCPMPRPLTEDPTDPVVGGLSFYHLNMIVSGACVAFSCLVIFALMIRHATHFSNPNQQLKIMRICVIIPIYAIFSFISIVVPAAYAYLEPWIDLFQAIALGDFFLLMSEFVTPTDRHRDLFFSALEIPQKKRGQSTLDGLAWYRKKWTAIFQYVVVSLAIAILTDIFEAANKYCLESSKPYFAHLWLEIIHNVSLVIAVMAVLNFYTMLKTELADHKPLAKLLAFKLLVGLNFLLKIIYWILGDISPSPLNPSSTMNYADLKIGLPLMITCIEMVPFSVFFHYAYSATPFLIPSSDPESVEPMAGGVRPHYQGGPLGVSAWLAFLNPSEIIQAVIFAFRMPSRARERSGDVIEGAVPMEARMGGLDGYGRNKNARYPETVTYPRYGYDGY